MTFAVTGCVSQEPDGREKSQDEVDVSGKIKSLSSLIFWWAGGLDCLCTSLIVWTTTNMYMRDIPH